MQPCNQSFTIYSLRLHLIFGFPLPRRRRRRRHSSSLDWNTSKYAQLIFPLII